MNDNELTIEQLLTINGGSAFVKFVYNSGAERRIIHPNFIIPFLKTRKTR